MRCPECMKLDLRSRIDEHRPRPEPAKVERFFDENGVKHIHDHAVYAAVYTCSNRHSFRTKSMSRCPAPGCAWNDQELVRAGMKRPGEAA